MRLGDIDEMASQMDGTIPSGTEAVSAEPSADSRALVAVTPAAASRPTPQYRQAAFLAQLLAIKDRHPQTRERWRAEPSDATAAYRAAIALTRFG
ncbi:MAG: hypothetical protein ACREB8_13705 [Pseudolabrys sp.]